ncbi:MAG: serine/threonine protein kinase [Deltaproteobacteria bacterium]|nr:MAG: serine/threonine protein kinase [Deltaproteobacteria bacterium]
MKCGFCHRPLESLSALCDCGKDPNAGWVMRGRYQLLGLIGQGGMGMIYRALDQETQELCAIKISRWCEALQQLRQMESDQAKAEEKSRIEREFKLLEKASSRNKHVVQVFDNFHEDSMLGLYYPMEFLEGQSLAQLPEWGQAMDPDAVVDLVLQLCEGVGVAHGLGVVHRDLNPENIFIVRTPEQERFVKLIDFGIARDLYARKGIYNTGSDLAFGHLHYLAPEQVGYDPITDEYQTETAAKLDHRADIYSIGAIMFHMLTGEPPFDDGTIEGLALRNWRKPPNVARVLKAQQMPHELQEVILSCLQPTPNLRLPDILVLSDLLRSYIDNQNSEAAFDMMLEHASQSPDLPAATDGNVAEAEMSWEFPALEKEWDLPEDPHDSESSMAEMSIFSQEFNALFTEDSPKGGLDFSDDEIPAAPSGALVAPPQPPPMPRPTPPPLPSKSIAEPASRELHAIPASPQTPPPVSMPMDVWNSLDNAPAFMDFEEVDESSANGTPNVVMDHKKMNVQSFFDGVEHIIEEHKIPQKQHAPQVRVLSKRSPQLEQLLSLDNLDVVPSLMPDPEAGLQTTTPLPPEPPSVPKPDPNASSDVLLASELLFDMEVEEEVIPSSAGHAGGAQAPMSFHEIRQSRDEIPAPGGFHRQASPSSASLSGVVPNPNRSPVAMPEQFRRNKQPSLSPERAATFESMPPEGQTPNAALPSKPQKKGRGMLWAALAILLLAGGAAAYFFLFK